MSSNNNCIKHAKFMDKLMTAVFYCVAGILYPLIGSLCFICNLKRL